jgi:glycine/D-amino acid oxidase-like deaminating enzyme
LINPLVYLPWLLKQYFALGGKHRKQKIDQISDVISDDTDIVVNCTGVRAKDLGGVMDKTITPTRGQNVIIRAPHIRKTISMSSKNIQLFVIKNLSKILK